MGWWKAVMDAGYPGDNVFSNPNSDSKFIKIDENGIDFSMASSSIEVGFTTMYPWSDIMNNAMDGEDMDSRRFLSHHLDGEDGEMMEEEDMMEEEEDDWSPNDSWRFL